MNPQQPPPYGAPPPPPYGAPPYGTVPSRWGPTSFGMEAHVLAGLSYLSMFLIGIIGPLIVFFVEKNNRFVKFHAAQGILIGIAEAVYGIVLFILYSAFIGASIAASNAGSSAAATAASTGFGLGFCLVGCVGFLGGLVLLAAVIWGAIAGFSGQATKLPLIGNIAEKWAGGPVTPAF